MPCADNKNKERMGTLRSKHAFATVSTTLTKGEVSRLQALADKEGIDFDALIARAIENYLERRERAPRPGRPR
jgi:hypothetical protein